MRSFERFTDLVRRFLGRHGAHFGLGARAKPRLAERNHDVRAGAAQRLLVGVGRDERDAGGMIFNHVLDRVAAAATNTNHLNAGVKMIGFLNDGLERHVLPFR